MALLRLSRSWLSLFPLLLVAIAIGATFRHPLVTDDPYITYRYALNLIQGNGFVYNPGEHVLSTTAPLYSILLAALGLIHDDIPFLGFWLSVLGLAVCAWFVLLTLAKLESWGSGILAALLTLLSPGLILTFGLETGFYLALAFGATYLYLRGRTAPAFAVLALLTLTRADGVLLALILGLDYVRAQAGVESWQHRRRFFIPFGLYLLVLLPWLAFAMWWFGSPFPFTLTAKVAQAQSGLWAPFASGFMSWLLEWSTSMWPILLFGVIGLIRSIRKRSRLLLLGLWAIAHVAAYSIIGVAFYAWYVAPFIAVAAIFAAVGVEAVAELLSNQSSVRTVGQAGTVIAAMVIIGFEFRIDLGSGMQQPSPKVEAYRKAADWIAENTAGDATVDALEVGVIGYFDQRRTYDFVGLVDPSRVPYLRSLELAEGVRHKAAGYVIMIPPDVWLPQNSWFASAYRRVREIRVPGFYAGKPLVIFERADTGGQVVESIPVNRSFDKRVDLLSVDLYTRQIAPGAILPVVLNLRAGQPLEKENKFTLQLVGAGDRIIAQSDTNYPARRPEDGQPFQDHQGLVIATNAPPGAYELILAMYDERTGDRASLYDASGSEFGDFLPLGKIQVR